MVTQIIIHLLPHEIDWFEYQLNQLKIGNELVNPSDKIILDVTLNLNLVDWESSELDKSYFVNKFNILKDKCNWCSPIFIISEDNECLGCNDKRRTSVRTSKSDNIIYLDTDLMFEPKTLAYIIEASKVVNNDYYIVSPQLPKMWDNSWDVLVNKRFINEIPSHEGYINSRPFDFTYNEEIQLRPINEFKFGGGWFNLFSTKLLQKIDIPDSLGPYGLDDTFIMSGAQILLSKGYDVQQYVLEEIIVKENLPHSSEYCKKLNIINKQDIFRANSHDNFNKEIKNLSLQW